MQNGRSLLLMAWIAVVAAGPATLRAVGFDEPDAETERCLSEGRIAGGRETLSGVTSPERVTVECGGVERFAALKCHHEERRGIKRFDDGTWELNFSDSYRYERAAYLLDRKLGLDMVPVAVIRKVRRECALVEWITNASYELRSPFEPTGQDRADLAKRKELMRLFDALIFNTDRNTQNYLLDDESWRLYLIDHSRAFRETTDLPAEWLESRARLSRELYESLRALDKESLEKMLLGLVSSRQIAALLERRDKILQKIERDRQEIGDEYVFSG